MKKLVSLILAVCTCFAMATTFAGCKHEHVAGDWETTVQPTCLAEGKREKLCECGESMASEPIAINPNNHANRQWVVTTPETCQASGLKDEYCMDCNQLLQKDVVIPQNPNSHLFDMLTNTCTVCGTKEFPEITSFDQAEMDDPKVVILLDYILDRSKHWTLTLDSATEYVRLVGTAYTEYPLSIKIASRETPITIDFVNATIYGNENATISSDAGTALNLGFYGEKSTIRGAAGAAGQQFSTSAHGKSGKQAISISGELNITVAATACSIRGGNGGNGAPGSRGADGGNGGNGAMAISAGSIKVSCKEGYTKDNFAITGGSGGQGGAAGGKFLFVTPSAGSSGKSADATNVSILYQ